jgi:hypothetical protein
MSDTLLVCRDLTGEVYHRDERQTEVCRTSATSEVRRTPEDAAREILEQARRFVSYCALPIGQESGVAA